MAKERLITRKQAIRMLREQRAQIDDLLDQLSPRDRTRPGLGGGEWSPKDLIGHLESWEEHALDALAAWERGERAPIDALWFSVSTSRINAQEVERKAGRPYADMRRRAAATHATLLAAIEAMTDRRWSSPATARARKPLGHRIGQILTGPDGPFTHDRAHLRDLRALVEEGRRPRR